jgi:hypothetical protein
LSIANRRRKRELIGIGRIESKVVSISHQFLQTLCKIPCAYRTSVMFENTFSHRLALSLTLVLLASNIAAQQSVYKWVDADGVVHIGDAPPPDAAIVETGTINTTPAPASAPAPKPLAATPATDSPAEQKPARKPAATKEKDVSEMSIAELDRRCEDAREQLIAPEREDHIASCKLEKRNDPDWCETYFADYGAAVKTGLFTNRPRMYSDIDACLIADSERIRRSQ